MAIMKWDESMSVGVAEFDRQHGVLIDLINQLSDAMSIGKGKDVLGGILVKLSRYTRHHFSAEEELFERYAYPEAQSHIQAHINLTRKVYELKNAFDSGKKILSLETMNFLKDWLNNHIMIVDKQYGPYFNSKGIK